MNREIQMIYFVSQKIQRQATGQERTFSTISQVASAAMLGDTVIIGGRDLSGMDKSEKRRAWQPSVDYLYQRGGRTARDQRRRAGWQLGESRRDRIVYRGRQHGIRFVPSSFRAVELIS